MASPGDIDARLLHCLDRLSRVLRQDRWSEAGEDNLHPTQKAILDLAEQRAPEKLRPTDVARHLGVALPTATDSINSLVAKSFLRKGRHPSDRRVVLLELTARGRQALAERRGDSAAGRALAGLSLVDRIDLLEIVSKLIRHLQIAGSISPQRLCLTCRYFKPYAHASRAAPHHCEFVDAPFGPADLRVDCGDHETAEPGHQAATWARFDLLSATPQATETGEDP